MTVVGKVKTIIHTLVSGEVSLSKQKRNEFLDACRFLNLKAVADLKCDNFDSDPPPESYEVQEITVEETEEDADEEEFELMETTETLNEDEIEIREVIENAFAEETTQDRPKVRLKSGELMKILNFRPETRLPEKTRKSMAREPCVKVTIDAKHKEVLTHRLESLIKTSYATLNQNIGEEIARENHKARLIMDKNRLMKGLYDCILCGKEISVVYTTDKQGRFKQWVNSNMRRHLARKHKDFMGKGPQKYNFFVFK